MLNLWERICSITGSKYAIATVNGTSALHISLLVAGVSQDTEVLTQAASFVATCNAISYCGAIPSFLDINPNTLGLSSCALRQFLVNNCVLEQGKCYNNKSGRRISACVPMHTFGHPCEVEEIRQLCDLWNIPVVEDAVEPLAVPGIIFIRVQPVT